MLHVIAKSYHKLLVSIDWNDELFVAGIREGLNKFLSNAYLHIYRDKNKYFTTHYISNNALNFIINGKFNGLVFEHIVPKNKYIQEPCVELARQNKLNLQFIENKLNMYWKLATITKEEDDKLPRFSMPDAWDSEDIFARYRNNGIELIDNPYFEKR